MLVRAVFFFDTLQCATVFEQRPGFGDQDFIASLVFDGVEDEFLPSPVHGGVELIVIKAGVDELPTSDQIMQVQFTLLPPANNRDNYVQNRIVLIYNGTIRIRLTLRP
jgi:hypothetical protein